MKTLRLGHIELMPIGIKLTSYKKFLDWFDGLSDEWKKADYKLVKYITSLKELGIFKNIENNYSVTLPTEIVLQVNNDFGFSRDGLSVIIDDPSEVEKFLNHEDAVGINGDGEGIDIRRGNSSIIDWSSEKSTLFVIREI
jgi:hypothetical protein